MCTFGWESCLIPLGQQGGKERAKPSDLGSTRLTFALGISQNSFKGGTGYLVD